MRQIAARADVSPSTMNRLARALDFCTYNEFRALYRDSINDQSAGYSLSAGQVHVVARETDLDRALDDYQQAALRNINTLFDHIDREAVEWAVQALAEARNVLVARMHASYSIASYTHYVATYALRNWHLPARHNGAFHSLLEDLKPADAVLCIAVEPCSADTIRIARRGREAGARVVGVTDRRTSPWPPVRTTSCSFPCTARASSRPMSVRWPSSRRWSAWWWRAAATRRTRTSTGWSAMGEYWEE